jgi:photosystem II stability/assembly factor-like uncharacterized protein
MRSVFASNIQPREGSEDTHRTLHGIYLTFIAKFTSYNYGVDWTTNIISGTTGRVVISEDGTRMAQLDDAGMLVYTSNDSGVTWVNRPISGGDIYSTPEAMACSSDGQRIFVGGQCAVNGCSTLGSIWASANQGANWTKASGDLMQHYAIACSSDGKNVFASSVNTNLIKVSHDYGLSWITSPAPISGILACSGDGSIVVLSGAPGNAYISTNYGVNWSLANSGVIWSIPACSLDGKKIAIAAGDNGWIQTSSDYGSTWITHIEAGRRNWTSIAISYNGRRIVAVEGSTGNIFIGYKT